jgi:hypothetical protein
MRGEPRSIRTTQSRRRFLRVTPVCPTSNLARSVVCSWTPRGDPSCSPGRLLRDDERATMTVRGFLDRVKDASPIAMRAVPLGSSAYALVRAR